MADVWGLVVRDDEVKLVTAVSLWTAESGRASSGSAGVVSAVVRRGEKVRVMMAMIVKRRMMREVMIFILW